MNQKVWRKGIKAEVDGWRDWLSKNGKKYEEDRPLNQKLFPFIKGKKKVRIADLGSGPISLIGNYLEGVEIEVVASDILANYYKRILKDLGLKPANGIVKRQDMTRLTYPSNSFDIVYCANALDHSLDPYKALKEMVRVCKPGGWIYLFHIAHEGQRNRYKNLHQWNLDMTEDGNCIVWNNKPSKRSDAFFLSDIYPHFKTELKPARRAAFVTSYAKKR